MRALIARRASSLADWYFDARRGIDTRTWQSNLRGNGNDEGGADAHRHEATTSRRFMRMLRSLDLDVAETTFLDLGSGLGRALILASENGFRAAVGVEMDPALVAQAELNLARMRLRSRGAITLLEQRLGDAATCPIPDEPLLVFLFNPFGEGTLRKVAQNISTSLAKRRFPLALAYSNPRYREVLSDIPGLECTLYDQSLALYKHAPR